VNKLNICIIQTTRIGDILQTYQAARQLKLENKNISLTLVARRKMASGLLFLLENVFDDIILFDTQDFVPRVKNLTVHQSLDIMSSFFQEVNHKKFNLAVNFSFSRSSAHILSLIDAKVKMGPYINSHGQIAIDDKWSQFVYSNVLDVDYSPFNLVDIFKHTLGAKLAHGFRYHEEVIKENIITIHPFASHQKKMWKSEDWAETIIRLLQDFPTYKVAVVGTSSELTSYNKMMTSRPLINKYKDRIINCLGKNSIQDTFDLLLRSKIFLGHDSMVSHLAAIAELNSIIVSLGPVKPDQTTAYSDKVITLVSNRVCAPCNSKSKCSELPCKKDITPALICSLTNIYLKEHTINSKNISENVNMFLLTNVNILKSSFDQFGIFNENLCGTKLSSQATIKTFSRLAWAYHLSKIELNINPPKLSQEAINTLSILTDGYTYLTELYLHGINTCNTILEQIDHKRKDKTLIKENVKKLDEIDKLIDITTSNYKLLKPFADFFYVNRLNSKGSNIFEITQNNLISFYEAQNFIALIEDLTNSTLGPKIISGANKDV
jgi:ADP-heptose:LPS heptosyltransferase